ncbi:MAG: hypothetical protein AAGJ92_00220 [Pseudomonadota bacterium]
MTILQSILASLAQRATVILLLLLALDRGWIDGALFARTVGLLA